jgi:hypothetical protein
MVPLPLSVMAGSSGPPIAAQVLEKVARTSRAVTEMEDASGIPAGLKMPYYVRLPAPQLRSKLSTNTGLKWHEACSLAYTAQ